jgi:hypothetical protein
VCGGLNPSQARRAGLVRVWAHLDRAATLIAINLPTIGMSRIYTVYMYNARGVLYIRIVRGEYCSTYNAREIL